MKKVLLLTAIILICGLSLSAQNRVFVDLGLSSGTKWCTKNETGYWSYSNALNSFGSSLPTIEQFSELIAECDWKWTGSGYNVKGPNGKSIYLPADGCETDRKEPCDYFTESKGKGYYWCYSSLEEENGEWWASGFFLNRDYYETMSSALAVTRNLTCGYMYALYSVRLVQ